MTFCATRDVSQFILTEQKCLHIHKQLSPHTVFRAIHLIYYFPDKNQEAKTLWTPEDVGIFVAAHFSSCYILIYFYAECSSFKHDWVEYGNRLFAVTDPKLQMDLKQWLAVAAEGIFEWGANQFARAPESAGPHLGTEGPTGG